MANRPPTPLEAGTALLARRDYASGELRAKLIDKGHEPSEVEAVVARFQAQRLVDDARYAERFVAYRAARGQGPVRIRMDLKALGLPSDLIEDALAAGPDFPALAAAARSRKFGSQVPKDFREKARQARFLQYRGFSVDDIRSAFEPDP
ncbi:MAG: regulatory protein RecX [Steroidobacteraceae bacterium]|jgi:regulatory protein